MEEIISYFCLKSMATFFGSTRFFWDNICLICETDMRRLTSKLPSPPDPRDDNAFPFVDAPLESDLNEVGEAGIGGEDPDADSDAGRLLLLVPFKPFDLT